MSEFDILCKVASLAITIILGGLIGWFFAWATHR